MLQPYSEMPWLRIFLSPDMVIIYICQFTAAWGSYTNLTSIPQYMEDILKVNIATVRLKTHNILNIVTKFTYWIVDAYIFQHITLLYTNWIPTIY